jgi:hypothetical protein
MSTIASLDTALENVALMCDNEINRRHNRLAIIGITIAIILAIVGIGVELWMINHTVSSLMDNLTSQLSPAPSPHSTAAR